ncbi:helix-turn-helix transcriptional regulator [Faecalibacillus intestinalis]|jgi:putative transcriptional regulator|nr:helix-turn-helix transcriptional regulator [Faecalibacillus intestinalis]RGG96387.1 XRE family transcriptional regulator [Coprobacillus sp. AF16-47]RHT35399.1 XRE family transcriptional regulator [Coprobacillus sp. AM32-11LB]RHT85967.1 XRE family transcriptional regulator [Coprobacillus sp. AM28-15LB]RHU61759.1 XRE family transcriptional regulator [Coprobacillus sp. TF10-10]DAE16910.1 MAG TPA: Helix-turn-helix XRE-family like protein [Siphoviridae sp. ctHhH6]
MDKLREFRESLHMSQKNMAKRIGVSPSYYYKVESGYQNPSYEFLAKFKRSFPNASVDQIFFSK